eukprot:CAMPEP_0180031422 /NCGR_PEP_ID=MMETSP0984-20121128/27908_1 /TAXON_ID=483367 /ORGANISM="non described non described, Strain CCMP 2436" /LENGTH=109 /DNA_ID=CAMNT_0021956575 /DNA_START=240 /DNA_END=569 /DNA_ORIENTATION=-
MKESEKLKCTESALVGSSIISSDAATRCAGKTRWPVRTGGSTSLDRALCLSGRTRMSAQPPSLKSSQKNAWSGESARQSGLSNSKLRANSAGCMSLSRSERLTAGNQFL